ncbi:MAG: glutathione S-transferase family protein, partial [Alphaproteobacteria bacterium]|nr:glutathione S-transferase family protein [Alphaproteobacteria bacterium]
LSDPAAILVFFCDRHPEANLAPPPADPLRPAYLQWMVFMAGTISTAYNRFHYPHRFSTAETDAGNIEARAVEHLLDAWGALDEALAGSAWTLGDRFSACDIYLQMFASWFRDPDDLHSRFTNVARVVRATTARPAVARAIERHER